MPLNQKGAAPVLILIAVIGLISFLAIGSFASFKNDLFSSLFPKPASRAATNIDVTTLLENLGNPTKARWADNTGCVYARNVWDLQQFNGKVYLGSGNSDNTGSTCGNAGPVDLWLYEASSSAFKKDLTNSTVPCIGCVDDEQIDIIRLTGGTLYIPGHDPKNNGAPGYYKLGANGWSKVATQFDYHNYDVYKYQNSLIAVGFSLTGWGHAAVSLDDGVTWQKATLSGAGWPLIDRIYSAFEIGNNLYVYGNGGGLFRYTGGINFVQVNSGLSVGGMIPQGYVAGKVPRVERAVKLGTQTVYIGAVNITDHQWDPVGLFKASTETNATLINLPGNAKARDILVSGSTIYVLAQTGVSPSVTNYVYSSTDLTNWVEVLHFSSDTFARSFEYQGGSFYFGMGTETTPLSNTAGTIYRVLDPNSKDVTSKVEALGNPFTNKPTFARNVWDMQSFNGKVYLGHGDIQNNGGPIDLSYYDSTTSSFKKEASIGTRCGTTCIDEEALDRFRIVDNTIYIPGADAKEGTANEHDLGNFYRWENGSFKKYRTIPEGVHVYDLYKFQNKLFAVTDSKTIDTQVPVPNPNKTIQVSSDNGLTWEALLFDDPVILRYILDNLFELNNNLYLSADFDNLMAKYDPATNKFLVLDTTTAANMFPGMAFATKMKTMNRHLYFNSKLVYVGTDYDFISGTGYVLNSSAAMVATDIGQATRITLPDANQKVADITTNNNLLYILAYQKNTDNTYTNFVFQTSDLVNTTEVFRFNSSTFARSFEYLNGDFYFGLGSESASISQDTGKILRVKTSSLNPSPIPTLPPSSPTPTPLPGDIIVNGKVDIFDYNALLQDFGKTAGFNPLADIVPNGKIDIFDYNGLLQNFGKSSP